MSARLDVSVSSNDFLEQRKTIGCQGLQLAMLGKYYLRATMHEAELDEKCAYDMKSL